MTTRLLLCIALFAACVNADEHKGACALLERLNGTVCWKANDSTSARTLDPAVDAEKILGSGDTIRCGHAGHAVVWMAGHEIELSERDGPLVIRCGDLQPRSAGQNDDAAAAQKLLEHYGRPAGRNKEISSLVFLPADGSTIEAKDFAIGWEPRPNLGAASITIQELHGRVLWQERRVSGDAGRFESDAAKQALARYSRQPLRSDLLLAIHFASGEQAGVHFSVLSEEREASLTRSLQSLSASLSGFLLHIARSYVFDSYGMYNSSAAEYEQALQAQPGSRDLLLATLAAEQRINKVERVSHLQKLLQSVSAEQQ